MIDLRDLLDEASRPEGEGTDPLDLVRAARRRLRRRFLVRGGIAAALVVLFSTTALVVRPWGPGPGPGPGRAMDPVAPASPTATPSLGPSVDPGHTPPGARLEVGQTALVPIKHLKRGEAELTVTGIRQGENGNIIESDLDADLQEQAERGDFWYVDVTITYVSGRLGGYYLDPDVVSVTTGGRQISQWSLGSDYAPCTPRSLPRRPQLGDSVQDCLVFQTSAGAEVVGLQWGQFRTDYDVDGGFPVTWR